MNEVNSQGLDLAKVREKLAGKSGKQYWRSLEEVAETPEFQAWVDDEFPNRSSLMQVDRRSLLKFMGASMMLAGLGGCRSLVLPNATIVPYVNRPEELVAGDRLQFASAYAQSGVATGIVVESHYGRPTKVEGNPLHAMSGGATDSFAQASILNLYDPDRAKAPLQDGATQMWTTFLSEARALVQPMRANGGKGFAVLMETTCSPMMAETVARLQKEMPNAVFASWEAVNRDSVYQGAALAFGRPVETVYDLSDAKVIVSLDGDFLGSMPGWLKYSRDWAKNRNADKGVEAMNRVYALETAPSLTGAMADHRMPVSVAEMEAFLGGLATALGVSGGGAAPAGELGQWVQAIAKDLQSRPGQVVVIPGDFCSAEVHGLCHLINAKLGAAGKQVTYRTAVIPFAGKQLDSLKNLVAKMDAGEVDFLLILGGDPVYQAPSDLKFAEALKKVSTTAHLGSHFDTTSKACQWHLAESHYLECWGDVMTLDGSVAIQQPLIDPIFDTKSAIETLLALTSEGRELVPIHDQLKAAYAKKGLDDAGWRDALNKGMASGPTLPVNLTPTGSVQLRAREMGQGMIEAVLRPDPTLHDGRFANNGWMQELPKPLTTLTWDNTVQISPLLAERMSLSNGDEVTVDSGTGAVKGAVWILPGQPENTITIHFGYGRDLEETLIAAGTGFNPMALSTTESPYRAEVKISKTGGKMPLAATQTHHYLEGRDIIRTEDVEEFLHGGHEEHSHLRDISMYPSWEKEFPYDGPQWGMTIDLNVCTGCHACVTACQSENNIPVVGKSEVIKGREMHWIRIDRYYGGKKLGELVDTKPKRSDLDNPETNFMPLACMHCEKAPCEPVCPVAATVHSHEGLNQMVYNRCVGTRYCSNNCPYKVRRFNFLNYNDRKFSDFNPLDGSKSSRDLRVKLMVHNPDVTVRGRGVMEKCTYCVQRINEARIHAKNEFSKGRREKPDPKEGEVVTACQQVCPTEAIVFGNVADANSAVSKMKLNKRNYTLIEELNTKNRTTYLKRLRNPNKELETA